MQIVIYAKASLAKNAGLYCIAIIGLLVSVLHFDLFYYSHETPKWFVFDVAITLYVVYSLRKQKELNYSYLGMLALLLIYLMVLSLWWAPHKVAGVEFILRFMNSALFIYCLTINYSKEKLTDILLNTIFISAFGFVFLFIMERYIFAFPFNVGTFSPIGFINNTSAVFNIWIPGLVIYLVRHHRNKLQFALSIFVLLVIVGVLMEAATRGAILGLTISELIVFVIVLKKNKKKAFLFLSITSLLLMGIGIYTVSDALQNGRLNDKLTVMKSGIGAAADSRLKMFGNTWTMTVANPFGVGVNNFEYLHPKYAQTGTTNSSPFVNETQILRTPHNLMLKMSSELGFVGGLIFIVLVLYLFSIAIYNAIKGDYTDKWMFVGASATLFHSMFSAVLLTPSSLFFFILLIAVINSRFVGRVSFKRCFSIQLPVLLKVAYVFVIVFSTSLLVSEYFSYKGRVNFSSDDLANAVNFNPQNDRALLNFSQFHFYRNKNLLESLKLIDRFLTLYPYHIAGLMMKAERHYQLKDLNSSKQTLDKLLGFYPSYKKARRLKQLVMIKIKQQKNGQ